MIIVKRYTADWCAPCKVVGPYFEEFRQIYSSRGVNFMTIDVELEPDDAKANGVSSIPCVCIIKNGQEVSRLVGAKSKASYQSLIESALN